MVHNYVQQRYDLVCDANHQVCPDPTAETKFYIPHIELDVWLGHDSMVTNLCCEGDKCTDKIYRLYEIRGREYPIL